MNETGPKIVPWDEIRADYALGFSLRALETKYKEKGFTVQAETIAAHRDRDNWGPPGQNPGIIEAANNKVVDLISGKAIEHMGGEKALEEHGKILADILRDTTKLYAKAGKLLDQTFDKALAGKLKMGVNQGDTTAVNDLFASLNRFTDSTRVAAGLKPGTPTIKPDMDDEQPGKVYETVFEEKQDIA